MLRAMSYYGDMFVRLCVSISFLPVLGHPTHVLLLCYTGLNPQVRARRALMWGCLLTIYFNASVHWSLEKRSRRRGDSTREWPPVHQDKSG